jgi:hypothetical protein
MQRLLSPFSRDISFAADILSDDLPDYSGELRQPHLDRAPYRLIAEFDGIETVSYEFNGKRARIIWPGPGSLTCGPVAMTFNIFDLETDALKRVGQVQDVRAWLREWSGISVYRDGFRVLPYGEPDDDWLRLDQRRVNNPVQRLSNNQICGMIEISSDLNADLRDQTNRGGLILNKAFDDLRRLVLHTLELGEAGRQAIRNPQGSDVAVRTTDNVGNTVESLLKSLRQHARPIAQKSGFLLGPVLDDLTRAYRKERKELQRAIEVHTDLSVVGHNAPFIMASLAPRLEALERGLDGLNSVGTVEASQLADLRVLLDEMHEGLDLLSPLSTSMTESDREIDLSKEVVPFS